MASDIFYVFSDFINSKGYVFTDDDDDYVAKTEIVYNRTINRKLLIPEKISTNTLAIIWFVSHLPQNLQSHYVTLVFRRNATRFLKKLGFDVCEKNTLTVPDEDEIEQHKSKLMMRSHQQPKDIVLNDEDQISEQLLLICFFQIAIQGRITVLGYKPMNVIIHTTSLEERKNIETFMQCPNLYELVGAALLHSEKLKFMDDPEFVSFSNRYFFIVFPIFVKHRKNVAAIDTDNKKPQEIENKNQENNVRGVKVSAIPVFGPYKKMYALMAESCEEYLQYLEECVLVVTNTQLERERNLDRKDEEKKVKVLYQSSISGKLSISSRKYEDKDIFLDICKQLPTWTVKNKNDAQGSEMRTKPFSILCPPPNTSWFILISYKEEKKHDEYYSKLYYVLKNQFNVPIEETASSRTTLDLTSFVITPTYMKLPGHSSDLYNELMRIGPAQLADFESVLLADNYLEWCDKDDLNYIITHCPKLTYLDLSDNSLVGEEMKNWITKLISKKPHLKLNIKNTCMACDDVWLQSLPKQNFIL